MPAQAGIQKALKTLDSRLRGNDKIVGFMWSCKALIFYLEGYLDFWAFLAINAAYSMSIFEV